MGAESGVTIANSREAAIMSFQAESFYTVQISCGFIAHTERMSDKAEAERIDKEWRQKYHDRFFNPPEKEEVDPLDAGSPTPKAYRFEDLFK